MEIKIKVPLRTGTDDVFDNLNIMSINPLNIHDIKNYQSVIVPVYLFTDNVTT